MILHHYDMSPFSEKIRLMLGYTGIDWQSAISPEMPPRPIVDPLAGGYRRIPVAQIGADIFCDSKLISAEIAALADKPELNPSNCDESSLGMSAELEGDIFWASVASIPAGRILRQLFRNLSIRNAFRFIVDRAAVARNAHSKPLAPKEAVVLFKQHLQELERYLGGSGPYLFGDAPSHTDFAAYHTFWFQRVVGELPAPDGIPAVEAWYQRMGEFGHGRVEEIEPEQAFAVARENTPRPIPDDMIRDARIGSQVAVQPDDYALDASTGALAGISESRIIIARDTVDCGQVHVHFPARGFELV